MDSQTEDKFNILKSITCKQELFKQIERLCFEFGFNFCAFVLQMPFPVTKSNTIIFSNYPVKRQDSNHETVYIEVEPCSQLSTDSIETITLPRISISSFEYTEGKNPYGSYIDCCQFNRDLNGVTSSLILGFSSKKLSDIDFQKRELNILRLAKIAHRCMSCILTPMMMPEVDVKLTHREIEVLRWAADGKTSDEASKILNISTRTVNFHVANAMVKFNSTSKVAAVARAAALGLLK